MMRDRAFRLTLAAAAAACALGLAWADRADAQTVPNSAITLQSPKIGLQNFVQGTDATGTYKHVYGPAPTAGSKCWGLFMTTTDATTAHLVQVAVYNGSTRFETAAVNTTLGAGTANAVPAINLMSSANWPGLPTDSDGNPFLYLQSGDYLDAEYATALTSATHINVEAVCADFQ